MASKKVSEDLEFSEAEISSRTSSTHEKARLIYSHDDYETQPTKRRSEFAGRTIFILSLSNVISILLLVWTTFSRAGQKDCVAPDAVHYPEKPKWFPPEIPITTILEADELYTQSPNEQELRAWDELMPLGRGLVMLDNATALPEMPNLDQSLPRGATAWIGISHQLHCLYSTKHAFYDLYNNQNNHDDNREKLFGADWNLEHLNHCWDYLRQGLMCNADVTLEWRGKVEGTGWGYERQCKDWNAIYHWIENHRLTNDRGILRDLTKAHPLDTSKVPGVWGDVYGPSNPPP